MVVSQERENEARWAEYMWQRQQAAAQWARQEEMNRHYREMFEQRQREAHDREQAQQRAQDEAKANEEAEMNKQKAREQEAEKGLKALLREQREAEVRRLAESRIRQQALERMMRESKEERAALRERIMQPLRAAYFQRKDESRSSLCNKCNSRFKARKPTQASKASVPAFS